MSEKRVWHVIINVPTYHYYCVEAVTMDEAEKLAYEAHNGLGGGSLAFVGAIEGDAQAILVSKARDADEVHTIYYRALEESA